MDCLGEALFQCKRTVTLIRSPIEYGKISSHNQILSLVCVIARAQILTFNRNALISLAAYSQLNLIQESQSKKISYVGVKLISLLVFSKTIRLNIILSMFLSILLYNCYLLHNRILPTLLFPKSQQGTETTHTCYIKFIFATGDRIKEPVYVCIGQQFVWEIYFPLLSKILIGFRLRPYMELVWHLSTQVDNGILAVQINILTQVGVSIGTSSPSS